jgi:hypothetical protein
MLSKVVNSTSATDFLKNVLIFAILIIIFTFIIKFLWNRALVPHVTVLKPVTDLKDALLLSFGLMLLR